MITVDYEVVVSIIYTILSVAEKTTKPISFITWVSVSNMSIVGYDEGLISLVFNSVLNVRAVVDLWYFWKALRFQVTWVVLLGNEQLGLSSNFSTDIDSFCISCLWVKGLIFNASNELGSLRTFQDSWVLKVDVTEL